MPKLNDFRQVKTITLPSYPDSKVVIYDSLLVGDILGDNNQLVSTNDLSVWLKLIKEWNFVNEKEEPLPITIESLKLLKSEDFQFLIASINELSNEVKKN